MTPKRYQECLGLLRLSQRGLAPLVGCSSSLARHWGTGVQPVPPLIAEWLEKCVAHRHRHPEPPPPKNWRHRPPSAKYQAIRQRIWRANKRIEAE
jgi:hypothetical protein